MTVLRHLKDKEAKQIVREFEIRFPIAKERLKAIDHLQELIVDDGSIIFADGVPILIRKKDLWIPSLKFETVIDSLPKVIVDMGAVPHITNGAQIMRPGIRLISDNFRKNDFIVIQDERFQKSLAIGTADVASESMKEMTKGKVITNLHYVGDDFWNAFNTSHN